MDDMDSLRKRINDLVFDVPSGMSLEGLRCWIEGLGHFRDTVKEGRNGT